MGIKTYNPYTPSRRNMTGSDFAEITKKTPEKSLCTSLKKNAGRNNQGKITVRHHGGGSRRLYRNIDFKRNKDGIHATVIVPMCADTQCGGRCLRLQILYSLFVAILPRTLEPGRQR